MSFLKIISTSTVFLSFFLMHEAMAENLPVISVGSKVFTEGYILSEIISQVIENAGEATVNRRFGLGGTGILYEALVKGSIDLYPEYSGTISEAILKDPSKRSLSAIAEALSPLGLTISESLGFNDTYAIALRSDVAKSLKIETISDLKKYPNLVAGFSHEFLKRPDGFIGLENFYDVKLPNAKGMEHSLAYEALDKKEIDLTDVYSTDAKIEKFGLVVLDDDKKFFPTYLGVILMKEELRVRFPKTWKALKNLEGQFTEKRVIGMNAEAELDKKSFTQIASEFLQNRIQIKKQETDNELLAKILKYTKQHLSLVGISLFLAILFGIPLGIIAARFTLIGQFILIISGVLQTIPSLALLCFLIPVFGIGTFPALVALFLYSLLPIVTGTYTGLEGIDPRLSESARALGLSYTKKLRLVDIPLASPSIMNGIKTSAIIGIGTATLAALIGAGGYGSPIITGLALNDIGTILQGAIPAAVMALIAHVLFRGLNRLVIPKGLPKG